MRMFGVLALALACGCGRAGKKAWDAKLAHGCVTEDDCELLLRQAESREAKCEPNTLGRVRCKDAEADIVARSHVDQVRRQRAESEARRAAEEAARDEQESAVAVERAQREPSAAESAKQRSDARVDLQGDADPSSRVASQEASLSSPGTSAAGGAGGYTGHIGIASSVRLMLTCRPCS